MNLCIENDSGYWRKESCRLIFVYVKCMLLWFDMDNDVEKGILQKEFLKASISILTNVFRFYSQGYQTLRPKQGKSKRLARQEEAVKAFSLSLIVNFVNLLSFVKEWLK